MPDPEASAPDNDDARGLRLALVARWARDRQARPSANFAGSSEVETAHAVGRRRPLVKGRELLGFTGATTTRDGAAMIDLERSLATLQND